MKLYLLNGGNIDVDRAVIHPADDSRRHVLIPCMQVLIHSEGKNVLFDTGMPVIAAGDSEALQREHGIDSGWIKPLMAVENRIDRQLAMLGLRPSDLDMVVNTHFHFDHAGGNALFAGVLIAAQEAELAAAQEGTNPFWDGPGLEFGSVSGDWSPVEGVEMLHTPGHTPGHQSMLVHFREQPWLFTWDAVYTEEHWREDKLGAVADVAAARTSMDRLRHKAEQEGAKIIFGHDPAQWGSLGMTESAGPTLVASE